jgi:hypothetical protein
MWRRSFSEMIEHLARWHASFSSVVSVEREVSVGREGGRGVAGPRAPESPKAPECLGAV